MIGTFYSIIIILIAVFALFYIYAYFRKESLPNTKEKNITNTAKIENSPSASSQAMSNSPGAIQIINPQDNTQRLLLQEVRYKNCTERYKKGGAPALYAALDSYQDLNDKEREILFDDIVSNNRASNIKRLPKENKYRKTT